MKNKAKFLFAVFFVLGIITGPLHAEEKVPENVKSADNTVPQQTVPEVSIKPEEPMLFVHKVKKPLNDVYKRLFTLLENNGYFIIFEPNIGRNLAHFAKRWGKDYNKNKLEEIRSMIFCNGWYANQVSNYDPDMTALCPLHITLTYKEGLTKILFIRPGQISKHSPANTIATELEQDIIRIIKESSG